MHQRTREPLDYLERQRAVLRAAFDAVPPALRNQAPGPGQWSATGCVEHLAIVERLVANDAVAACDGLALGEVSWPHPLLGPLTAYQWIAFHGAHEVRHAAQIREIAAARATT